MSSGEKETNGESTRNALSSLSRVRKVGGVWLKGTIVFGSRRWCVERQAKAVSW